MYYSHKARLVFIRVPKTGSTSAYHALKGGLPDLAPDGDPHEFYRDLEERKGTQWDHYHHIGFVRWPLDWLTSLYSSLTYGNNRFSRLHCPGGSQGMTPSEFLAKLRHTPYDWFTDANGNVRVTEIYRTEDMAAFSASMGQEARRHNETKPDKRFSLLWTADDIALIRLKFARELDHYPEWQLNPTAREKGIQNVKKE